jgi:hypothetical protein
MARPAKITDSRLKVGNASRGGLLCSHLTPLKGRWSHLRQAWRHRFAQGEALLLQSAPSVHSWGQPQGLVAIFLDADWCVLQSQQMQPRRWLSAPSHAQFVLLLPALPAKFQLQPGDRLELIGAMPRLG